MTTAAKTRVIDADAHVIETEHTRDYMDPSEEKFRPVLAVPRGKDPEGRRLSREYWVVDGKVRGFRFPTLSEMQLRERSQRSGRNVETPQESREMDNVSLRLQHMDKLGIDTQVLHNTLFIEQVTDRPEVDVAICRSWNRWMAGVWKQGGGRLFWSCVPPLLSIPDALDQVREAREHGAVGVCMRPIEGSRVISDPYFYPVYEEALRLDMPIVIHIANASPAVCDVLRSPHDPGSGFATFRAPTVIACHTLMVSELPRLFPTLRWGFVETAAQWVPWVAREAASRWAGDGRAFPEDPLRHFNIFVTCQNDDDLPYLVQQCGDDHFMIGTDYGHFDPSSNVDAITEFKQSRGLSPESIEKIVNRNPAQFYGL